MKTYENVPVAVLQMAEYLTDHKLPFHVRQNYCNNLITIKEYCEYITHKFLHNSDDKKVR